MAEPSNTEGQAAPADSGITSDPGTTAAAPQSSDGQSANPSQTTSAGPDSGQSESFFDPKSIEGKPELQAAYKQMQAAYTKKSTQFKEAKNKIEAYDRFMSNPSATMQELAQQYGYQLVQRGQDAQSDDFSPKTWDDVMARAKQEVMRELEPTLGEIRSMKQQNVEQYLDNNFSDWRTYEDDMLDLLQAHPTLAKDPDRLYQMAVPSEVLEARAMKRATEKLRASGENAQVSGPGTTKSPTTEDSPPKGGSFNDMVAYAKERLRKQGITPGL